MIIEMALFYRETFFNSNFLLFSTFWLELCDVLKIFNVFAHFLLQLNITFNDDMTKLFEYPSETSFLEEGDEAVLTIKATHDVRDSSSQNSAANSKGMSGIFIVN